MLRQRRKNDISSEVARFESTGLEGSDQQKIVRASLYDYLRFVVYCMLLAVPLYAITISVLKHDWIMVVIDALIVPVGFVHGLLLLFGYVS